MGRACGGHGGTLLMQWVLNIFAVAFYVTLPHLHKAVLESASRHLDLARISLSRDNTKAKVCVNHT